MTPRRGRAARTDGEDGGQCRLLTLRNANVRSRSRPKMASARIAKAAGGIGRFVVFSAVSVTSVATISPALLLPTGAPGRTVVRPGCPRRSTGTLGHRGTTPPPSVARAPRHGRRHTVPRPGDNPRDSEARHVVGPAPVLSVVVPMYDEEAVLPLFAERLRPVLDGIFDEGDTYEVLVVDDGSRDATPVLLLREQRRWPQLRVVRLRANAGHQAALSAGLARARGAWVATLDADLQDPPELLPQMLAAAPAEHVDVVYGVRTDRSTDSAFKRLTARAYYRLMQRLVGGHVNADAGDFRLMSRATVDAVNTLPDHHRVLRLVVPGLGFPSTTVPYRRAPRAAGTTKYPLSRMLRLTVDSLTGYSVAPLRLATWFGLGGALVTAVLLAFALSADISGRTVPGWTSTFVAVAAVGTVQLLCLGLLGEYVGRLYTQMQGRPSYFVARDSLEEAGAAPQEPDAVAEELRVVGR